MYITDRSLIGVESNEFAERYPVPRFSGSLSEASSQYWVRCKCGNTMLQPWPNGRNSQWVRNNLFPNCSCKLQCFQRVPPGTVPKLMRNGKQVWMYCRRGDVIGFMAIWPNETLAEAANRICPGGQGAPQWDYYIEVKCSEVGPQ